MRYVTLVALISALGGFLMGFDASVISGVVRFVETEFALTRLQVGWTVSSLAFSATLAMMVAGPLSDRIGRRPLLQIAALLFLVSAIASALAASFATLVAARMLGGLGVGAALIIAPMYISELAPAAIRGRLVSFNQLNIVIGISAAFLSNYLILTLGQSAASWVGALGLDVATWRWMLGIEALPALIYLAALLAVPESPRWLLMRNRESEARSILERIGGEKAAALEIESIRNSVRSEVLGPPTSWRDLLAPSLRWVLLIGLSVAILQQITGINAVFFYAPMIFELSGVGTNAAFMQAVLLGLVNLAFTVLALMLIDRLGRKPLLLAGLAGIAVCMFTLAYGFGSATYTLEARAATNISAEIDHSRLAEVVDRTFASDVAFREALVDAVGDEVYSQFKNELTSAAIEVNATLIMFAMLGFVASFAVSIGPVMWVLFSELFPNRVRAMAISIVGVVNSTVAFLVTLVFPWELATIGNAATFAIYGGFATVGFLGLMQLLPETKGRSLEELEVFLARG